MLRRRTPLRPGKVRLKRSPLRPRRAALPSGGRGLRSAKGGTGLRQTRLRAINPERRARLLVEQFGPPERRAWIASLPCLTCGRLSTPDLPSHNSHIKHTRAADGGPEDVGPQCWECHHELEHYGTETFCRRRGRTVEDLFLAVDLIAEQWHRAMLAT